MSGVDLSKRTTTILLAAALVAGLSAGVVCSKGGKRGGGACVDVGGADCGACLERSTAPFCAPRYVTPQASGGIKVNGRKGCCGFEDPALRSACENILLCIRSQGCAAGNSPTRCLCGDLGLSTCATASEWSGACTPVYKAALAGGPPGTLIRLFGDPRSPIGVANNTFQCDVDAQCPCGAGAAAKK
jgi:hypothetical protein